jgi:hypothetical protein
MSSRFIPIANALLKPKRNSNKQRKLEGVPQFENQLKHHRAKVCRLAIMLPS